MFNFDNVFQAYLSLFVVMTFEGWPGYVLLNIGIIVLFMMVTTSNIERAQKNGQFPIDISITIDKPVTSSYLDIPVTSTDQ